MKLFETPLRVGPVMSRLGESVALDVLDPSGLVVASFYGPEAIATARAAWLVLQTDAHPVTFHGLPADNDLDEQAYQKAKDESNDA